ncbi:MAG: hypothetical protein PUE95_00005 [Lachnospiraceae bacterium]|nr:hypothetical protein [Lachnospiraceae bacterium]MDD6811187.1 hypothetical protein [Lachnospiraceae bacterium]
MKNFKITRICIALCLILGLTCMPICKLPIQAAEIIATVSGTVLSGTTSDLLQLSTKEGKMQIKLDSGTDASACKILLPGKSINVSVSHGSDGYLHAVKITTGAQTNTVSVDTSKTSSVTGTISEKTTDDIIYLNTAQGEMQIKLDTTTNLSGCSVLVAGKTYTISCARGADAFMHAISISDAATISSSTNGSTSSDPSLTPAPATDANNNISTSTVSGTVTKNTKENMLCLSTSYGEMQIVIDSNTDSRNGMFLMPDRKLTVTVYRGSDAYMHAATITGVKTYAEPVSVDTSKTSTVTGTVSSKSTENVLYLNTSYGEMELKLDAVRSISGLKVLVSGKKITVTCARGSDAYMHAVDIIG